MLFTIAIAPLHWLFAKACSVGALNNLRLPPQLRASLYADDTALFVSPNTADIETTKQILLLLRSASGKANVQKSVFLPIACEDINLQQLLQNFQVATGQFPCKYLGLPLNFKNITRADVQPTLNKLASMLQRWRGKLLSSDARLRYVNLVLSAIPVYLISLSSLTTGPSNKSTSCGETSFGEPNLMLREACLL